MKMDKNLSESSIGSDQQVAEQKNVLQRWSLSDYDMVFIVTLFVRLCAALFSNISDCDETFNYWEPTHYLLFGSGQQTWEYDPKYALRSYFYLLPHAIPGFIYNLLLTPNKVVIFYITRCVLAFICSGCEVYFYQGVRREFGTNVAKITLCFSVLSAGMFISSTAFLPSSTSMLLLMLSYGAWFQKSYKIAIFTTALSTFVSWPFAALLGVSIALDILFRQKKVSFTKIN